ncbi:MAG: hypothetical protein HYX78_14415 [Armatimonadetes bacterium]|nr:hypothetical protein [Armatimonadota bacterium]
MLRILPILLALTVAAVPAVGALLGDLGEPSISGALIGAKYTTKSLVQPFELSKSAWLDRIGVGVASAVDPNRAGFRVSLTENLAAGLPGTTLASWSVSPQSGATFAYVYIDFQPILVVTGRTYGLLVDPGDDLMSGSVAFSRATFGRAWATSDGWITSFALPHPVCIRVYGTVVPEGASLSTLLAALMGLSRTALRKKFFNLRKTKTLYFDFLAPFLQ